MNSIDKVLEEYFSSRTSEFWNKDLKSLPERWKSIVENEGKYILD